MATPQVARAIRFYSTTGPNGKPGDKERNLVGPFSPLAAGVFLATGVLLYTYLRYEKARIEEEKEKAREDQTVGKPRIGGPFELIDHNGKTVSNQDFLGKFMLIYFGFTHCPDICPEELDKMSEALEALEKDPQVPGEIVPIFITCDPQRDGVEQVREYIQEFHPRLIGLTGSFEDISKVAKAYRVYFSKPPTAKPDEDYLVDHSIFFYMMDPRGEFLDAFGRETSAEEVYHRIKEHMRTEAAAHQVSKDAE
ncbi:Cu-binding protein [Dispira simplex]|nr:Cu-binding protein [Dispira simplex]